MGFLAEILADIILAVGFYLVHWCMRHKEATGVILSVMLVVVDIIVLYYIVKVR